MHVRCGWPIPGCSLEPGRIVRRQRRRIRVPSSCPRSSAQGLRALRLDVRPVRLHAVPPDAPVRPQPDARPHARPAAVPDVRQLVREPPQDAGPSRSAWPHAVPPDVSVRPQPDAQPHARPAALPDVRQPARGPLQDTGPPRSAWPHAVLPNAPVRPQPGAQLHAPPAALADAAREPPLPQSDAEQRQVRSRVPLRCQASQG